MTFGHGMTLDVDEIGSALFQKGGSDPQTVFEIPSEDRPAWIALGVHAKTMHEEDLPGHLDRIEGLLRGEGDVPEIDMAEHRIDVVSVALLRDLGIAPYPLAVFGRVCDAYTIDNRLFDDRGRSVTGGVDTLRHGDVFGPRIRLSRNLHWHRGRLDLNGDLPEIVQSALVGEPLARFVRHPLLDRFGLVIASIEEDMMGDLLFSFVDLPRIALRETIFPYELPGAPCPIAN